MMCPSKTGKRNSTFSVTFITTKMFTIYRVLYLKMYLTELIFQGVFLTLLLVCQLSEATEEQEKSSYSALNYVNLWNTVVDDGTYTIPWRLNRGETSSDFRTYGNVRKQIPIVAKQLEENTCLRFKRWNGEKNFILLQPRGSGCYTSKGRPSQGCRTVSQCSQCSRDLPCWLG